MKRTARHQLWIIIALAGSGTLVLALLLFPRASENRFIESRSLAGANVLLITLDTTRADRLGAYGYERAETPNLDRLASEGALFENCIAPSAFTLPSHSSIMTGTYPPYHGVRLNGDAGLGDAHSTLAEQLRSSGYRTGAFVGAFVLDGRWGLEQGFDHYNDDFELEADQPLDLAGVQRRADQVVDAALPWLEEGGDSPFFAWLHFYDPHTPYEPPEPYRSRFQSGDPSSLYDGEIAFADSQVGRVLDWLSTRGLDQNTIVVVAGDHGEGLGSHGEIEHGYYIYDYAVRVPLIVRLPSGQHAGSRVSAVVRTIDIAPTIAELLGSEPDATTHGESLGALMAQPDATSQRHAYSESMAPRLQYGWSALYSVRTKDYKYISAPREELYDLQQDPGETANRLDDMRRVTHELRAALATIREQAEQGAPEAVEANLDQETMAQLTSLGYLGGSTGIEGDDRDLPDPKDKFHLYEAVGYAAQKIIAGNHEDAARTLQLALDEDPDIPQALMLLASAYRKTGETAKAKSILDAYLRKDSGNPRALVSMAEILLEEGKGEDVLAICRRALAEDERNARAWELMADVFIDRADHPNALLHLKKVVEIQPKLTRSRNNLAASLIEVGRHEEAEQLLREIIALHPSFPLVHYHLGLLREEQERLGEARTEYEAEIALHPESVVARFNLGNLLFQLGDLDGAEAQMTAIIEHDGGVARAHLMLARFLLNRPERLDEAERSASVGLEKATEHDLKALGYFLLADIYSRQGKKQSLEKALQKARYHQSLINAAMQPPRGAS